MANLSSTLVRGHLNREQEDARKQALWTMGRSFQAWGDGMCKGPEVGEGLVCSRKSKGESAAGMEKVKSEMRSGR